MPRFERVGAVVVTHNRRELLADCLAALQRQTRPPEAVVVVDNASTDGTARMLAERFPAVTCLALPTNTGGAGGFHAGMTHALGLAVDGLWLMDDDSVPAPTCLAELLAAAEEYAVRAPLVVSRDDPEHLAFGYLIGGRHLRTRRDAAAVASGGLLVGTANPFNGLLVHRSVVERVGLPLRELFIWGDEREYLLRLRRAGFEPATVLAAELQHPPNRMQIWETRLFGRRLRLPYADDPLRQYLFTRNDAYIARRYHGWTGWLAHLVRHLWFTATRRGLRALGPMLRASLDGLRGRLGRRPTADSP